jgi:predicted transcriptional regulator
MGKQERTRHEIIQDMLLVALEERSVSKTRIMQKAHLNPRSFQRYFQFLLESEYLIASTHHPDRYQISETGKVVIHTLREANRLVNLGHS